MFDTVHLLMRLDGLRLKQNEISSSAHAVINDDNDDDDFRCESGSLFLVIIIFFFEFFFFGCCFAPLGFLSLHSSRKSVSVIYPAMKFNTSHFVMPGVCLHTSGFMFLLSPIFSLSCLHSLPETLGSVSS